MDLAWLALTSKMLGSNFAGVAEILGNLVIYDGDTEHRGAGGGLRHELGGHSSGRHRDHAG